MKGTAKVVPDPNEQMVKIVQREFELRAQANSYDSIRARILEEGLVPADMRKSYSRHGVEERLKNPFYWGHFYLTGDPKLYQGKHEQIIPKHLLKAVEAVNSGNVCQRKSHLNTEDIFRGWLRCGHPECGRTITYEQKKKTLKSTGGAKIYHLYRCADSRKIHEKKTYISEEKIWKQFEPAIDACNVSEDFAKDIVAAMNEIEGKQKRAISKQMEGFRLELKKLEQKEDVVYGDYRRGMLDDEGYRRQFRKIREDRDHYNRELERSNLEISDAAMMSVKKMFELAINAKSLWKEMSRHKKLEYLKKVCSNQVLEGLTVEYQLQKPFARLARMKENSKWRRGRDSNPRYGYPHNGFRDRPVQPLWHLSIKICELASAC